MNTPPDTPTPGVPTPPDAPTPGAPAPVDNRKRKQNTLIALYGASLLLGIVAMWLHLQQVGKSGNDLFMVLGSIMLLLIGFYWLHLDSAELDIRRPAWLNVGIVALAVIFVPYYLYKTRPPERRMPAIGAFFGVVLVSMVASEIGAAMMAALAGAPPSP